MCRPRRGNVETIECTGGGKYNAIDGIGAVALQLSAVNCKQMSTENSCQGINALFTTSPSASGSRETLKLVLKNHSVNLKCVVFKFDRGFEMFCSLK